MDWFRSSSSRSGHTVSSSNYRNYSQPIDSRILGANLITKSYINLLVGRLLQEPTPELLIVELLEAWEIAILHHDLDDGCDIIYNFLQGGEPLEDQLLIEGVLGRLLTIHDVGVLRGQFEVCILEVDTSRRGVQHEPEIYMNDVTLRINQHVAVMTVLDLQDVAYDGVRC